jgi:Skp family chaperone for outer membrane proteins
MKKAVVVLLGLIVLVSCAEKVVEEPENLIPHDQMIEILYDLSILNAAKSGAKRQFDDAHIDVMGFIYTKYNIDSTQFAESDLYYASLPTEYQKIYQNVEAMLERKKDTLEAISKRLNDSIREANLERRDSLQLVKEKRVGKKKVATDSL